MPAYGSNFPAGGRAVERQRSGQWPLRFNRPPLRRRRPGWSRTGARQPTRPRTPCPPSNWRPSRASTFVEFDLQLTKDQPGGVPARHLPRAHDRRRNGISGSRPFTSHPPRPGAPGCWKTSRSTRSSGSMRGPGSTRSTAALAFRPSARRSTSLRGRSGLFIEVKAPERYEGIERLIMAELKARGLDRPGADARTPVLIQSFSADSLKIFKQRWRPRCRFIFCSGRRMRGPG